MANIDTGIKYEHLENLAIVNSKIKFSFCKWNDIMTYFITSVLGEVLFLGNILQLFSRVRAIYNTFAFLLLDLDHF